MNKTLKKVISSVTSLVTILWSVSAGTLVLPSIASAATLAAGDLIKASGPSLYYYAADGKRYVFPNEKTYFSWYADFSSVKTITDAELAAVSIGGNVTIRPGTKLVKVTTIPKTYAVTQGGTLRWLESEAIAKALYGDNWAKRVVDVPDAFFTNYKDGASISTNVHPNGQLIQYTGDANWYVVWDGNKRKIASEAALTANWLNKADAVLTTMVYPSGTDVTAKESVLADVVVTVAVAPGTTTPTPGGALTVALASDTPAGMTTPKNASSVPLMKVNLSAAGGDVLVTSMRFHRFGVGATGDFSNVYLYDQNGQRLTTGRTINSTGNTVEFNTLNITVPDGKTWAVLVYGDFSTPTNTGGQHAFQLVDASTLILSKGTASGSFPIRGNTFTVGTAASARVDLIKGTTPSNPTIGSKGVEISNFKLMANTNDVAVQQLVLYQSGSITNTDLTNFELYQGATKVASSKVVAAGGQIVLKFSPAYMITNGTTKVFSLRADVGGRAGRTISTYVEYTTDVGALDQVYNAGAQICIVSTATGCSAGSANFDGTGTNLITVTTQGGQLTNAFNGPPTANIAKGQLAVPLYKFALSSPDSTLEIRKVVFTIAKTSGSATTCKVVGSASTPTRYFRSIRIINQDTGKTVMGPQETTGAAGSTSEAVTFTDSWNINAGQNLNLALVSDLANSQDSGDTFTDGACVYTATFSAFGASDVRVVSTGEFLDTSKIIPNSNVTGNSLTVKSSSLEISLASNPVTGTVVRKQSNVDVVGIVLTSSAQSDITVTSLTLAGQADKATTGCAGFGAAACNSAGLSARVTSLALYDGTMQVGLAKAPDTTTGKAQISNMNLVIPKSSSKTLMVKATFSSTASSTSPYDKIAVGIAAVADVSAQDQDSNTVTPTLSTTLTGQATGATPSVQQSVIPAGTITVQADGMPVSNIVIGGKDAWVPLAQYKATAQYEQMGIDRIAVLASSTSGYTSDNANIGSVAIAVAGAVKGWDTIPSGATGTKDIDLSTNKLVVPKDGSIQFQLWAKLKSVTASSTVSGATTGVTRSGHAPALGLNNSIITGEWDSNYASKLNLRVTGDASGDRIYAATGAAHGNSMIVRKSQPIVTKQSLSSTTLANSDWDLLKFQVAADSAGSIAWKQVTLNFSKSSATALASFRLRRGSTDMDTGVYAITNATSAADLVTGSLPAGVNSGSIIVAFKPGQEESISGSGNVYTIHASVSGAVAGQSLSLSFNKETSTSVVTGYLANFGLSTFATGTNNYVIDTSTSAIGAAAATSTAQFQGTFVWTDNSEVPHSSALGNASSGGSRDWINDLYVQDLSQTQTLSL